MCKVCSPKDPCASVQRAVAGGSSILCPVAGPQCRHLPRTPTGASGGRGRVPLSLPVPLPTPAFLSAAQGEMFRSKSSRTFQAGWNASRLCFLSLMQEKGEHLNSAWIEPFFFLLLSLRVFSWEINYLHSLSIRREIFYYHFLYWRAYYDYIGVIVFKSKGITNISMSSIAASNYFCFQLCYNH